MIRAFPAIDALCNSVVRPDSTRAFEDDLERDVEGFVEDLVLCSLIMMNKK
jgi:hypothetical protein